jgi:hypothetical protein
LFSPTEEPLLDNDKGPKSVRLPWNRRRRLHVICAFLVTISLPALFFYGGWTSVASRTVQEPEMLEDIPLPPLQPAHPNRPAHPVHPTQPNPMHPPPNPVEPPKAIDTLHPLMALNGPPAATFRGLSSNKKTSYLLCLLTLLRKPAERYQVYHILSVSRLE